jgi:hypothetical protein
MSSQLVRLPIVLTPPCLRPDGLRRHTDRQSDEADRAALADLREGRPAESQAVRASHGWEHEHESPEATREAMADAVVADVALRVRSEEREVLLPASFVAGLRHDATPNLSHAWARTVDGAQGGTWEAAHLLGTAALDALRA